MVILWVGIEGEVVEQKRNSQPLSTIGDRGGFGVGFLVHRYGARAA